MRRYVPSLVLFALSPFVAEFLFGATPVTNLFALLPGAAVYGGGAVLIRELARRRGPGWGRIALLGAAYAIIEEGLALQSMFNPALFNAADYGGRAYGVNWVWSEWTVGYHIVWSITIPILLAELLFPARRTKPWLGRTGVLVAAVIYSLGVLAYAAIFRLFVAPGFEAPVVLIVGAILLVAGLAALALGWRAAPALLSPSGPTRPPPSPWLVGLAAFLVSGAWFILLDLPTGMRVGAVVLVPMLAELALAAAMITLIQWWSTGRGWADIHQLSLAIGAMLVTMLVGFITITASNRVDQIAQGIASVVTILLLALFAWQLQQRKRVAAVTYHGVSDP